MRESLDNSVFVLSILSCFSHYINPPPPPPLTISLKPVIITHQRHYHFSFNFLPMDNQEMLLKFKAHIIAALLFCLAIFSIVYLVPKFFSIMAYFLPLILSTSLFLMVVHLVAKTGPPARADASVAKHGEELLHYVAGHHHPDAQQQRLDTHSNKAD